MTRFMDVCQEAARAGGQVLRDMRGQIHAREKAPKDLVTEADIASQEVIRQVLARAFPEHDFLGEEGPPYRAAGAAGGGGGETQYCWVVDPLDGTLNYVRQLPNYSVSVALRRGHEVLCGTVYDPILDECFSAESGQGATLNGVPIRSSHLHACGAGVDRGQSAGRHSAWIVRGIPVHRSDAQRSVDTAARFRGSQPVLLGPRSPGRLLGDVCENLGCGGGPTDRAGGRRRDIGADRWHVRSG